MGYQLGYARVSTDLQEEALQVDALRAAGCDRIFIDKVSGTKARRPELDKLLEQARSGDTLVVWRLDRLGRSMSHLIDQMNTLKEKEVSFRSLTEGLDLTGAAGELYFHITAAFAQFERQLIVNRTNAGLAAARARGRVGGRPPVSPEIKKRAVEMQADRNLTVGEITAALGIKRSTYYRIVAAAKDSAAAN